MPEFLETNPHPIVLITHRGQVSYANRAARSLLIAAGWKPGELAPDSLRTLCLDASHAAGPGEYDWKSPDGRLVAFTCVPQLSEDGVTLCGADVTEVRQLSAVHDECQQRLAGIVEAAMDAMISVDEQQRIVMFNPAAEKMFRCRAADALGGPLDRFIPSRYRDSHRRHVAAFGETGTTTRQMGKLATIFGLRADGEEFPIEASISQGQVQDSKLFTVILRDITGRVQAEKALQGAKEAAESASAAKSQFLASISHELRTPMNAILGMTDLALLEALPPRARDCLETAKESAELLLDLLNQILDFSRIEAGRFELESLPFSLHDVVDQVIRTLGGRASEKGLELFVDVPEALPDGLIGDPLRLRQVLMNLIANAIKFTGNGEIVVQAKVLQLVDSQVTLQFSVADTGIGINRADHERIFAAFMQADASITRQYGGSGLGLAIAGRIVALMGGRIWVESTPGEGSTFFFTVTLLVGEEPSPRRHRLPDRQALQGVRVLVVSDNVATRRILEQTLSSWGMRPETACDVPVCADEGPSSDCRGGPLPGCRGGVGTARHRRNQPGGLVDERPATE